jgi:hypothetical protein
MVGTSREARPAPASQAALPQPEVSRTAFSGLLSMRSFDIDSPGRGAIASDPGIPRRGEGDGHTGQN